MKRRWSWGLVAAAAVTVVVGWGPSAYADAALTSTSVKNGATLDAVPKAVTFTFNEEIQARFTRVNVTGGDGAVKVATSTTNGAKVSQELPATLPDGDYTVAYRVVSADGHPVSGKVSFTLDLPEPAPSATATSAPASAAVPTTAASTPGAIAAVPTSEDADGAGGWWLWLLGALVVTGVLAVVLVGRSRRRPADG